MYFQYLRKNLFYLKSANEIVGAFHGEEQLRKDYAGRQIYELLQNADDEAGDLSEGGEVAISFFNGVLSIKPGSI